MLITRLSTGLGSSVAVGCRVRFLTLEPLHRAPDNRTACSSRAMDQGGAGTGRGRGSDSGSIGEGERAKHGLLRT